ncbi:MAG: polysaccharide deacetylase family protein [Candidatus Eiseniibacteriota bacterium]
MSGRLAAAVVAVFAAGVAAFGWARWSALDTAPDPQSDLALPSLFSPRELSTLQILAADTSTGVPVLCYHYFRPGFTAERLARVLGAVFFNLPTVPDKDFWTTTAPSFESQMAYLHANGYRTIDLDQLVAWQAGRGTIPEKSVVITIDDGDRSVVEHAVPVLRRYGYRATLFLITGLAGESSWNDLDLVDWETLRDLEREGVLRVESHTHGMHSKVRRGGDQVPRFLVECHGAGGAPTLDSPLGEDLRRSREAIARELGHESRFLAWPFGFGSSEVDSLANAAGFERVLTLRPARNPARPGGSVGRYAVTARTSPVAFRTIVDGLSRR